MCMVPWKKQIQHDYFQQDSVSEIADRYVEIIPSYQTAF